MCRTHLGQGIRHDYIIISIVLLIDMTFDIITYVTVTSGGGIIYTQTNFLNISQVLCLLRPGMSKLASKLGQIGPKSDKSGTF